MADKITITDGRFKGEYELDNEQQFTNLETRWIKKIAGVLPMQFNDAFKGGDTDLWVALAVIAMVRQGRISRDQALAAADALLELPAGDGISYLAEEVEEESPPSEAVQTTIGESEPPLRSIGGSSPLISDLQANSPNRTGALG